jgi:hypothetical protein
MYSLILPLVAATALARSPNGPWDSFNYAPKFRTVYPKSVFRIGGHALNASNLLGLESGSFATVSGQDSYIALDFGVEVGISLCSYLYS